MTPRISIPAFVMTMLLFAISTPAAPEPPKTNPEWYLRRDTWQETLRLSREALAGHLEKTPNVGCDDQSKVWLNGQFVQNMPNCSRGTAVQLPLKEGENQLLLKLHNIGGDKGYVFSLPTEAQWEFTCRGGAPADQGGGRTWGVDAMPASVAEWTRTTYRPYPYAPGDGRDDGSHQGRKVVRGAGAIGMPANHRDTCRLSYDWWQGVWNVGFRVICEDEDPTLETVVAAKCESELSSSAAERQESESPR